MTLKVPEIGLQLHSPTSSHPPPPPQIFALSLNSSVLDNLIQTSRQGGSIQLSLGKSPTLQFGSKSHRIAPPKDSAPYEVYQTYPWEASRDAVRIPVATSLFAKPPLPKTNKTSVKQTSDSALDSSLAGSQTGQAAPNAAKEKSRTAAAKAPKAAKAKNKLLSGYNAVPRSIASSPAPNATPSPAAVPALSSSQQAVERAKEQRFSLVHELAVGERQIEHLRSKWTGRAEDFKSSLEKVAEYRSDTKQYSLKKFFWKELDVWNYNYDGQADREAAIENAIRQYDKQRLSASEPEWQRLLKKEERDKGKCLSRLQASLAKGPAPPAPRNRGQKAADDHLSCSPKDEGGGDAHSLSSDRSRAGGDSMSRSNSSTGAVKTKKTAEPKRTAAATKSKAAVAKPLAASKPKAAASKASGGGGGGGRVLSQAIIENSDSSGDDATRAKRKETAAPVKEAPRRVTAAKPATKATGAAVKRPAAEDDELSSSSGTPLSKRLKQKPAVAQASSKVKERVPEAASKALRTGAKATAVAVPVGGSKTKNTSATKSKRSPLASSPPTNASDLESSSDRGPVVATKKRKSAQMTAADDVKAKSAAKRRAMERVPVEVLNKASKFKVYYAKYQSLHYQIAGLEHPPEEKVNSLVDMRDRLATMKREIYGYREIMA